MTIDAAVPTSSPRVLHVGGGSASDEPDFDALLDAVPDPSPVASPTGGEDLAVLLYTSGTSGRPRGAMLSHRALLADLEHVRRIEPPPTSPDGSVNSSLG